MPQPQQKLQKSGNVWQPAFTESFIWAIVASAIAGFMVYYLTKPSGDYYEE